MSAREREHGELPSPTFVPVGRKAGGHVCFPVPWTPVSSFANATFLSPIALLMRLHPSLNQPFGNILSIAVADCGGCRVNLPAWLES